MRYLPEALIADVPKVIAGLQFGQAYKDISVPKQPHIRRGPRGTFHGKGVKDTIHHAVIPNVNTIGAFNDIWPQLTADEKKLFEVIARAYLAVIMPDFQFR